MLSQFILEFEKMNSFLVVLCLVTSPESPYKVGVTHFPPMIESDGALSGSDYEMFEQLADELDWVQGKDYEYKVCPNFQNLIQSVKNNDVQIGLSGISVTHDRLLDMHFSQPYKNSGQRILIPPVTSSGFFIEYFRRFFRADIALSLSSLVMCWVIFGVLFWLTETKTSNGSKQPNILTVGDGADAAYDIGTTVGFGRFYPVTRMGKWPLGVACFFCSQLLIGDVTATLAANKYQEIDNVINSPKDLEGKTVAVVRGTTSVETARSYGPAFLAEKSSFYEAVVEMRLGNVDAVVADEPVVLNYVKDHPDHAQATGVKFHPEDYGIAFSASSADLVKQFSIAIAKLREAGKLEIIEKRWYGE